MPLPENIIYNQFLPNKQTSMWKTKSSYNTDIQKYILKKMSANYDHICKDPIC